jgi:hypothetical protein
MDQLQDPSIITATTSTEAERQLQAQDFINKAMEEEMKGKQDNAITKFLRDAENKREKEETEKDNKPSDQSSGSNSNQTKRKDPLNDIKNREFLIEDWDFEFVNQTLTRYLPSQLLDIRKTSKIITPENLPPKSFYRLRSNNNNNNSNNNNSRNRQNNYNSRNFADGTGSMGNFSLDRRGHNERGHHNNNRRARGRNNKKTDDLWLEQFEGDGPAGNADDFEKWKAKINSEERKKRGEVLPEQAQSLEGEEISSKNSIDSFFGSAGGLSAIKASQSAANTSQNKNSKFFSFFKPGQSDQQPDQDPTNSNKDGVSKILSFLDKGEQSALSEKNEGNAQFQQSSLPSSTHQNNGPSSRSQFNFNNMSGSPAVNPATPQFPPGLGPSSEHQAKPSLAHEQQKSQNPKPEGSKDSFFMSLLQKTDATSDEQRSSTAPQKSQPQRDSKNSSPLPSKQHQHQQQLQPGSKSDQQKQQSFPSQSLQQPPQQDPRSLQGFPPGFQVPPGFPPPGFPAPQGLPRSQLPPGFENSNNGKLPSNGPPPGFPAQGGLPPWLAGQQMGIPPPHLQQFQLPNGQFLPPPNGSLPPGIVPPPHLSQQHQQQAGGQHQQKHSQQGLPQGLPPHGPNNANFPPHLLYGRPPPNGQIPPPQQQQGQPPMFFPGKEGEQGQGQGRFPPGFFNGPPGLPPQHGSGQGQPQGQQ